jgi:UDP-glucose 4-epimerase
LRQRFETLYAAPMALDSSILITGGCGYIGAHIVHALHDRGLNIVVVDNLSNSRASSIPENVPLYTHDILDTPHLIQVMRKHNVTSVVHMAAFLSVEESVRLPLKYYRNNVDGVRSILEACQKTNVKKLVFSSTAATYASSEQPLHETDPQYPSSPYGHSKLMAEQLIRDVVAISDLKAVVLRYFNVAGADPQGRTGQIGTSATHLIARACQAAAGDMDHLTIFGTDYTTKDGTCVRDYIHVSDLADIHRIALDIGFDQDFSVFNCGYGHGYSVREIAEQTQKVTGKTFPIVFAQRRPGDLAQTVADTSALKKATGWQPHYDHIETIISTAWSWYQQERQSVEPAKKRAGQA